MNQIFKCIRDLFGQGTLKQGRRYVDLVTKIEVFIQHRRFNEECKSYGVIPQSLKLRTPVRTARGNSIVRKAEVQLVKARISETCQRIRDLKTSEFFLRRQLVFAIGDELFEQLRDVATRAATEKSRATELRHEKKLDCLKPATSPTEASVHAKHSVVNLSSKPLSKEAMSILSKGFNFNIAEKPAPIRLAANVEQIVSAAAENDRDDLRSKLLNVINKSRVTYNITPAERKALVSLRNDKDIVVVPADKGNQTVVFDRADYNLKVNTMLEDASIYEK